MLIDDFTGSFLVQDNVSSNCFWLERGNLLIHEIESITGFQEQWQTAPEFVVVEENGKIMRFTV